MNTIRSYGINNETLNVLSVNIHQMLIEKTSINSKTSEDAANLLQVLLGNQTEVQAIIQTSIVYSVGNFDRIEKTEFDSEVGEDGKLTNLRPVEKPGYVE